ncbi:hypothetical protein H311_04998 [Anncaliia algerae PRA109]|nr:hypothetical protein H311_04998 [Anncaliia algerae PRA109]
MDIANELNVEMDILQKRLKASIKAERERGEDLYALHMQSERLENRAEQFHTQARETKKKLLMKNLKWIIIGGIVVFFIILLIYNPFS